MGKYYLGTGTSQINFQVVDATGVISDLNLSGLYLSVTGKAADADKLDNFDSSYFLNAANITGNISGNVTTNYLNFTTGLNLNPSFGQVTWADNPGSMQVGLAGGNVDLNVGFQSYEYVTNRTPSSLSKGTVVYVSGAQGNRPAVAPAIGVADVSSATTFGLTAESIASMGNGYVITQGLLTNLNTTGFAEGAALYLSPTVSGSITSTKPQAPQHSVLVGFCVRSHQSAGEILVKIQNGLEFDELHDVRISGVQNNDIVRYNSASGVWYNSNTLALDGTGTHYVSGSLGIGTSTPTAKLEVLGGFTAYDPTNTYVKVGGAVNNVDLEIRGNNSAALVSTNQYRSWLIGAGAASGGDRLEIYDGGNYTTRFVIKNDGNVGIGTTSPSSRLEVSASVDSYWNGSAFTVTPAGAITITNTYSGGYDPVLIFRQTDSGGTSKNAGAIGLLGTSSWTAGNDGTQTSDMYFLIRNSSGGISERMRITSAGNVGIGTASPLAKLHVVGDILANSSSGARDIIVDSPYGNPAAVKYQAGAVDVWRVGRGINASTMGFEFYSYSGTAGTRMIIDAITGAVGINEGNPTYKLQVNSGTDEYQIAWKRSSSKLWALGSDSAGTYINNRTDSILPIYIKNDGNVGIGTTTPGAKLEIGGTNPEIRLGPAGTSSGAYMLYNTSGDYFSLNAVTQGVGYRNIVFANDGGNVGIGQTNPAYKLDVTGTGRFFGNIALITNATSGDYSLIQHNYNGVVKAFTGYNGGSALFGGEAGIGTAIQANGQYAITILTSGNVGVGTTSPTTRLHVAGTDPHIFVDGNFNGTAKANHGRIYINDKNFGIGAGTFAGGGDDDLYLWAYNSTGRDIRFCTTTDGDTDVTNAAWTTNMVIKNDGKVGIGITSPTAKLDVFGGGVSISGWSNNNSGSAGGLELGWDGTQSVVQSYNRVGSAYTSLAIIGSTIRLLHQGGNVGIGVTNPSQALHVSGSARITGAIYDSSNSAGTNGQVLTSTGSGTSWSSSGAGITGTGTTNYVAKFTGSTTLSDSVIQESSGKIGINVSPSSTLDVSGASTSDGSITFNQQLSSTAAYNASPVSGVTVGLKYNSGGAGAGMGGWTVGKENATDGDYASYFAIHNRANGGAITEKIRVSSAGNVGIGTSPSAKLHVYGSDQRVYIQSSVDSSLLTLGQWDTITNRIESASRKLFITSYSGGISLGISGSENVHLNTSGNLGIGTTSPTYKLHVVGDARIGANGQRIWLYDDGNAHIHGATGPLWINSDDSSGVYINAQNNGNVILTNYTSGTGKVGIGTSSPLAKLHVEGVGTDGTPAIRITTTSAPSTFSWATSFMNSSLTAGKNYILLFGQAESSNNSGYIGFNYQGAGSTSNFVTIGHYANNNLLNIAASGYVGIGTTSPSYKLDVLGDTDTNSFRVYSSNASYGPSVRIQSTATSGRAWNLISNSSLNAGGAGALQFWNSTDSVTAMVILPAGAVGIGSSSPDYRLTIAGDANTRLRIDSSDTQGIYFTKSGANNGTFRVDGSGNYEWYTKTVSQAMVLTVSGSLGVGTTSPSANLHVYTTGTSVDFFLEKSTSYAVKAGVNSSNIGYFGSTNATAVQIQTNGSARMYFDTSGNVGIGTTSPAYKLDVTGTARITSDVTVGGTLTVAGSTTGSKSITVTNSYTTGLTISLNSHAGVFVRVTIHGDLSGNSAIGYMGEFFVQNGGGAYSEPGMIIREVNNTNTGSAVFSCNIVDPAGTTGARNFDLQFKQNSATASVNATIIYTVQGTFNSIS